MLNMTIEHSIIKSLRTIQPDTLFILDLRNGVVPKTVYCRVFLVTQQPFGSVDHQALSSTYNETTNVGSYSITQGEILTLRLTYQGKSDSDASYLAKSLWLACKSFIGTSAFEDEGMSIQNVSQITQIPMPLDNTMFIRHTFDLTIGTKTRFTFDTNAIKQVNSNNKFYDDSGEILIYEKDLEVTKDG